MNVFISTCFDASGSEHLSVISAPLSPFWLGEKLTCGPPVFCLCLNLLHLITLSLGQPIFR